MALFLRGSARATAAFGRCAFQTRAVHSSFVCCAAERRYTQKHEWVSVDGEIGTVGITDFAAEQLGDVVYVELPDLGVELAKGDSTGAIESVKAASDVYAPISGTVTEKNEKLESQSGEINKSPFEGGWLYKLRVKDASELNDLLTEEQYQEYKDSDEGH